MKHSQSLVVLALAALSMTILPIACADPAGKTRNIRTRQAIKVKATSAPTFLTSSNLKTKSSKAAKARTATRITQGDGGRK
jgi:hypothetical protein